MVPNRSSARTARTRRLLIAVVVGLCALGVVALPWLLIDIPAVRGPAPLPQGRTFSLEQPKPPAAPRSAAEPLATNAPAPSRKQARQNADDTPPLPGAPDWNAGDAAPWVLLPQRPREAPLDRSPAARAARVRQFGGSRQTEDAVAAGLAWLAAHQMPDGTWSRTDFTQMCPSNDVCSGAAVARTDVSLHAGITGLSLLAFLGAGHTDRAGRYRDTVARAVAALLRMQREDGGFSADVRNAGYNDALGTFALGEYVALTDEPRAKEALRRAVGRLVRSQQPLGGWDYLPRPSTGRNDTSITAWMIQALQAATAAGVAVPHTALVGAALHLARATQDDGRVWYADADVGFRVAVGGLEPEYRYGPALTAAGLMCDTLLGMRGDSPMAVRQAALLNQEFPSAQRLHNDSAGRHTYYYWYYGTVAMFQLGGPAWERWNAHLRDAILPLQDRGQRVGGRRHQYGSWAPFGTRWGKWGRRGGRVYTTALCVLTLETYYRHAPAYLSSYEPLTAGDWRRALEGMDNLHRRWAVRALRQMRLEIGEPVLVDLLQDKGDTVAFEAAAALAEIDSPVGLSRLNEALSRGTAEARLRYVAALKRARRAAAYPSVRGVVRAVDFERKLATVDLPRAYVGMRLRVMRSGHPLGTMRVIRRHSGMRVVVAELEGDWPEPPRTGDEVESLTQTVAGGG